MRLPCLLVPTSALLLAGCGSSQLAVATDSTGILKACATPTAKLVGGASDALWIDCEGDQTFQAFDGKAFHPATVPGGVPAIAWLPAADKSLWVTSRDPAAPTTGNARKLLRLASDGTSQDHTSDVNPQGDETLSLAGQGGVVVIERGTNLYLENAGTVQALPAAATGVFRLLNVLPVLGDGKLNRFFLHLELGAGPATELLLWDGSGSWVPITVSDPTEALSDQGWPLLFVPFGTQLIGLTSPLPPQSQVVNTTLAVWDGTTMTAQAVKLSVEVGVFGIKQLFVRQDKQVVLLGLETEGDTQITDRLAYYEYSGADLRNRTAFDEVQSCARASCTKGSSDPVFLTDGELMYVVDDASSGYFQVLLGRL